MTLNAADVQVAVTGAIYVAPFGTTAPTAEDSVLVGAFADLGYADADGVTEKRDRSSDKIKAWQGARVVRETVTESSLSYSFTLIETNRRTVTAYYGTAPDGSGRLVVDPSANGGRKAWVIDVMDGAKLTRIYVPEGEVTEVGEQKYKNGEPIGYKVTITAYPSAAISDGSAVKFYGDLAA